MQLAFYYAQYGTVWDKTIAATTFGPFSHTELLFPDHRWFSASPRDGGVRFKTIDPKPGHWHFIPLDDAGLDWDAMLAFASKLEGKRYDWIGILPPPGLHLPWRWFCSEVCAAALKKGGWHSPWLWPAATSPNGLYRYLVKKRIAVK